MTCEEKRFVKMIENLPKKVDTCILYTRASSQTRGEMSANISCLMFLVKNRSRPLSYSPPFTILHPSGKTIFEGFIARTARTHMMDTGQLILIYIRVCVCVYLYILYHTHTRRMYSTRTHTQHTPYERVTII